MNKKAVIAISVSASVIAVVIIAIIIWQVTKSNDDEKETKKEEVAEAIQNTKLYNVILIHPDQTWTIRDENDKVTTGDDIQKKLDDLYDLQQNNEFGEERYAVCFIPGTYQLNINVGYFTSIIGLGATNAEVVINGTVNIPNSKGPLIGSLDNFWRSCENVTIIVSGPLAVPVTNVSLPNSNFWRASQAAPFRRNKIEGNLALAESVATGGGVGGFSSGGYVSDCDVSGEVFMQTQQQYFMRNSNFTNLEGGAWNIMLDGCIGEREDRVCEQGKKLVTSTEKVKFSPFKPSLVYMDGKFEIQVADLQKDTTGMVVPKNPRLLQQVHIVNSLDTIDKLNNILDLGVHLVFPPAFYVYDKALRVTQPGTVILGLGYATLQNSGKNVCLVVEDGATGVHIAGMMFSSGTENAPVLLQVGETPKAGGSADAPTILQDITIIVAHDPSHCETMCIINQNHVVIDHCWAWRGDHDSDKHGGLGFTNAQVNYGLIVEGDDVTTQGLFVEHTKKELVLWKGNRGYVYFFQSELAYDVPIDWDYNGVLVTGKEFVGVGMGVYSFFSKKTHPGSDLSLPSTTAAIKAPSDAKIEAFTIFLNADTGQGSIKHVLDIDGDLRGQISDIDVAGQPSWCSTPGAGCPLCDVPIPPP